ncbi:MAG: Hpt domain-containing protein [Eubacteriales bacterium]|nr:Hpt domain-containing protein [Eubacteriales bacterium]
MTLQEVAAETGIDLETTLARFANMEMLLKKFLKKFPDDKSFQELSRAIEAGDYPAAEHAAHTLKGVAGNLGFQGLFEINQKIVDAVRAGNTEEAAGYFRKDKEMYDNIVAVIKQLD